MKTREEQIVEMAKDLEQAKYWAMGTVGSLNKGFGGWYGAYMYKKGYRKQSEVIDEFVERLKEENEISLRRYGKGIGMTAIFRIADEMKFELFKQQEDNNG